MLIELFIATTSAGKLPWRVLAAYIAEPAIVFEDDDLLVVDKPGHMACHSSDRPTLAGWLRGYLAVDVAGAVSSAPASGRSAGDSQPYNTTIVRMINRLDRETSGLVIVAKNERTAKLLGKQVLRREIEKEYLAICWGEFKQDAGVIDSPIGITKNSAVYTKRVIDPAGKPSVTEYEVIRRLGGGTVAALCERRRGETTEEVGGHRPPLQFTVVRLKPRTGRAHQLRVHLASVGHPIVGDKIYGPDERLYLEFIEKGVTGEMLDRLLMPRHALHAARVTLRSCAAVPAAAWATGETPVQLSFAAPLPDDMRAFIEERS